MPVHCPAWLCRSSGMRYATPEAGRDSIEPPSMPKMEQKAIAAALFGAKGQKKRARREARRQVAAWTMIGLFHLEQGVSPEVRRRWYDYLPSGDDCTC